MVKKKNLTKSSFLPPLDKSPFKKGEAKKLQKHFFRSLYLQPNLREEIREEILQLKESLEVRWPDKDNPVLYSKKERKAIIDWSNITSKLLTQIGQAEKFSSFHKLKFNRFGFYLNRKNKDALLESKYFKVCENRFKVMSMIFSGGLPKPGQTKRTLFLREELPKKDWQLVSQGRVWEKFTDFREIFYTFRGGNFHLKLRARVRGDKEPYTYMISLA